MACSRRFRNRVALGARIATVGRWSVHRWAPVSQRGVSLVTRDKATRWAINAVRREFGSKALTEAWEEALAAPPWDGPRQSGSTPT